MERFSTEIILDIVAFLGFHSGYWWQIRICVIGYPLSNYGRRATPRNTGEWACFVS